MRTAINMPFLNQRKSRSIKLRGNSLLLSWSRRSHMQDTNWTKRKSTNGPLRKSWKSKMEIRTLVLSIRLTRNTGEK